MKDAVTVGGIRGGTAEIEFVCGDFTVFDWSDGKSVIRGSTEVFVSGGGGAGAVASTRWLYRLNCLCSCTFPEKCVWIVVFEGMRHTKRKI